MRFMPHSRRGALWRAVLAAVIVIGASAATTAVAGLLQFKNLVNDLNVGVIIHDAPVTLPSPGAPQTILIIGSDHRAGEPFKYSNTDTMLLVRLNGSSQTINLMSVPRDLQVQIPGVGTSKLNAAYSYGGSKLLVTVLKTQVFPGLQINHIVDVNFGGFQALVNAIGCVYTDVDHRYYNNTAYTGYSSIDIQPGYQKLCGTDPIRGALAFVRFRHSDSDLVRNARQQDFIRWAKDQYGAANLISNRDKLLKIFGAYTETDHNLHTLDGLINLFDLVAFSAGHTIKQIVFPAVFLPCGTATSVNGVAAQTPCYVTASATAEAGAFRAFMRPTAAAPTAPPSTGLSTHAKSKKHSSGIPTAGLTADVTDGHSQVAALSRVAMPVYYPRLILAGSSYCLSITGNCPVEIASPGSYPRGYTIHDQQGRRQIAYRMTIELNPALGEYYGVQGTTWRNPPILAKPSEIKFVGGKRLELFANGGKLSNVAWRTPHGVYWISNTLTTNISNQQMVGIAASLTRASS
jgi:LCP family protein required for cell wall assembly